ncbi:MAG: methyltransferase domain-containing protein [Chthonomonadetes bacterium]|nr:methyltransferase domain-containing protein [Chthonomonadetes bacterium]
MTSVILRYPTHTISIPICRRTFRLTAVRSVDDLITESTSADEIPFWAVPWHASVGLCQFLCASPELVRGKRVLELGTGLGLCGIVAQWLGAQVTLSDYQPDALEFALWNASQNGIHNVQTLLADWRRFPEVEPFDVVIAADVLYERHLHASLQKVLMKTTDLHSRVFIADPWRDPAWEFIVQMEQAGWQVDFTECTARLLESTQDVIVFDLRPPRV